MMVQYASHLYIRIDKPLRTDLAAAADAAGQNVSAFARGILRGALERSTRPERSPNTEGVIFRGCVRQVGGGER